VPGNFTAEIVSALARAERRGRADAETIDLLLGAILDLPLRVQNPDPAFILAVARTHRLTGYDAAYLALALQTKRPLATVDIALHAAAVAEECAWAQTLEG
jgi:predicted nucleic acid-binding protein